MRWRFHGMGKGADNRSEKGGYVTRGVKGGGNLSVIILKIIL
jgi:hypothetical protein